MDPVSEWENTPLAIADPEIHDLIEEEKRRQCGGIELSASENFTPIAVIEALGSARTKKCNGGNERIDQIENVCLSRALKAFDLDPQSWGVKVQPYSGYPANFELYMAVLQPQDRILGLDLHFGSRVTCGSYASGGKKRCTTSISFESSPYQVNSSNGYIDYDRLKEKALEFSPMLIMCGGSAYPRDWDYARFREIADKCGALLLCDMTHFSGLVAAQEANNPFEYCDIVTTTTHKSLKGPSATTTQKSSWAPRVGMIFYRKGPKPPKEGQPENAVYDFEDKINIAFFSSLQPGPRSLQISALAVALKLSMTPLFKTYAKQVKANAVALGNYLMSKGHSLVTGGTENHLVFWDLRPLGLTGNKVGKLCNLCSITVNSALPLEGVSIGTPAMTSIGLVEKDFEQIGEFLHRVVTLTLEITGEHGKLWKDFEKGLVSSQGAIKDLKADVEKFAASFYVPGFLASEMKY